MDSNPVVQQKRKLVEDCSEISGHMLYDLEGGVSKKFYQGDVVYDQQQSSAAAESSSKLEVPHKPIADNRLICVHSDRIGEREAMEDRVLVEDTFPIQIKDLLELKRSAFYAIFDGHAGFAAAEFLANNFINYFSKAFNKYLKPNDSVENFEKNVKKIFIETYKNVDDAFLNLAKTRRPPLKDGSTACTILLLNNTIYIANVGDTKAILCRFKSESDEHIALTMTIDHTPQAHTERMRIQKSGGIVKDGRVMGLLEVSRSIGDGSLKSHGIICTPDIKKLTLTPNDRFLIIACDGLWKVFTAQSAMEFVLDKQKSANMDNVDVEPCRSLWTKIADALCAEAVLRGCGDNVSVLIVVFRQPPNE